MEFEPLIQKLKFVNSKAALDDLLIKLSLTYGDLFQNSAGQGHAEVVSKILELAHDKLSKNDIFWGFNFATIRGHTEVVSKILDLAHDKLSINDIVLGLNFALSSGNAETVIKILELAKDELPNEGIAAGFHAAVIGGSTEAVIKVLELAKDKIANEVLLEFLSLIDKENSGVKVLELVEQIKADFNDTDLRLYKIIKALKNDDNLQIKALIADLSDVEKKEISTNILKSDSQKNMEIQELFANIKPASDESNTCPVEEGLTKDMLVGELFQAAIEV
jgi:folylpolyglutamate synthase/dihydropteroate synthase